jgi:hypothetical protein
VDGCGRGPPRLPAGMDGEEAGGAGGFRSALDLFVEKVAPALA